LGALREQLLREGGKHAGKKSIYRVRKGKGGKRLVLLERGGKRI